MVVAIGGGLTVVAGAVAIASAVDVSGKHGDFVSLGTDGFGFSDTRPAARRFFTVDGPSVAARALGLLARRGEFDPARATEAVARYRLRDVTAGTTGSSGGDA